MTFKDITIKNLKYNLKRYLSYFFVNCFVVSVLFMYGSLLFNDILNEDPGIQSSQSLIVLAAVGILIFSVVFLTYTGIYFVKSRGKEFGVYLTLGMTTGDLSKMVIFESFIVSVSSALTGVLAGLFFSKLFYLVLGKVLNLDNDIFFLSYKTFLLSIGVFLVIFLFNMAFTQLFIRRMSIVDITKSSKVKGVSKQSPMIGISAFMILAVSLWFFNAIVTGDALVKDFVREYPILAPCLTFIGIMSSLFFVIGSGISGLRVIFKKSPRLYNRHILLLSGLSHRFLSYRIALYSVTLLITLAVFFIGVGMSFYKYTDMTIDDFQGFDYMIERRGDLNAVTEQEVIEIVESNGGEIDSISTLPYLDGQTYRELRDRDNLFINYRMTGYIIKESDYNRHMKQTVDLAADELLLVYNQKGMAEENYNFNTLIVDEAYDQALRRADEFRESHWGKKAFLESLTDLDYLEYPQEKTMSKFAAFINSYGNLEFAGAMASVIDDSVFERIKGGQLNEVVLFNLKSGDQKQIYGAILKALMERNIENGVIDQSSRGDIWASSATDFYDKGDINQLRPISKAERYEICYRANGFLLFALAFLGILFLISSFIVLYYKLISDSDEDAEQVSLLKKIGLSVMECRSYLQTHVAIIFFAPLALGGFLGLYLVNNFVSFTPYRDSLMLGVITMFCAVAVIDVLLFFSLRKRFFRDVGIWETHA